jgi:hypothetical protein
MFDGGALDPFARPPHAIRSVTTGPDGAQKSVYLARFETPVETVGGVEGGEIMALIVGNDSWIGASLDGPWQEAPNMVPPDHEGFARAQIAQTTANLTDITCDGTAEVDGMTLEKVSYTTHTDPMEVTGGAWFGARYTAFIDPETNLLMRMETRDFVAHYAPEPGKDLQVITYTYDPDIKVDPPQ